MKSSPIRNSDWEKEVSAALVGDGETEDEEVDVFEATVVETLLEVYTTRLVL